jgi:hypothetical protein
MDGKLFLWYLAVALVLFVSIQALGATDELVVAIEGGTSPLGVYFYGEDAR